MDSPSGLKDPCWEVEPTGWAAATPRLPHWLRICPLQNWNRVPPVGQEAWPLWKMLAGGGLSPDIQYAETVPVVIGAGARPWTCRRNH
ncbi:hypothetical protein MTBSS4_510002 [Magnetospirillum sp. SS-4]|nr:hypothetical protein MTBSS4_510002 [Magnetospirillum sp. SS-4]